MQELWSRAVEKFVTKREKSEGVTGVYLSHVGILFREVGVRVIISSSTSDREEGFS